MLSSCVDSQEELYFCIYDIVNFSETVLLFPARYGGVHSRRPHRVRAPQALQQTAEAQSRVAIERPLCLLGKSSFAKKSPELTRGATSQIVRGG